MPTKLAQYNGQSKYYFCEECNGNHLDDPQYPGRENKREFYCSESYAQGVGIPARFDILCQCCQVFVDCMKTNEMAYVCGHTKTFCLTCATHHLNCQHDHAVLKLASYKSLVLRLQLQECQER